ncbi:MAG: hypothetical protein M3R72_04220 [Bacteroidota bacterium]|nr:hypothetical protein [Bacteroidota bacterium]
MKNVRFTSSLVKVAGLFVFAVIISSWQPEKRIIPQKELNGAASGDTTTPNTFHTDEINLQLNLDSIMQQVNIALQKVDYQKINTEVQKAMAQVNYKKMNNEIHEAMKNIDWNKMKMDVSSSLDSAEAAIDKIDWNQMKTELSNAQAEVKKAMAEQKINSQEIKREVEKSLKEAQENLGSAKAELANYKGLQTALMNDGIIDKNKPYTIELKNGVLYINGAKQSKFTTDKYSKYYSGKKNFVLKNDGGSDL